MRERAIFFEALDRGDPAARAAYLDEACAGDAELRRRVEVLLQSHAVAGTFLDTPAGEQLAARADLPTHRVLRDAGDDSPAGRPEGAVSLHFLAPSRNPDSLGRLGHYEVL